MEKEYCTAIVLAAGRGSRMGTKTQKQYLDIHGKPVLYYSLRAFQESSVIDEVILVVGKGQEEYCRREIVENYNFEKVKRIVEGGSERYESVWNALREIRPEGYVFIHDGARPFVTESIICRTFDAARAYGGCVAAMPVKDTIKVADEEEFAKETPDRNFLWQIQTPQVFRVNLVRDAYALLMESGETAVTDDAMVVEQILHCPIKLVRGSYRNIKITTPEDLLVAEVFAAIEKEM